LSFDGLFVVLLARLLCFLLIHGTIKFQSSRCHHDFSKNSSFIDLEWLIFDIFHYWQNLTNVQAIQTPKQRAANAKFEKKVTSSWGKAKPTKAKSEFPLSSTWIILLVFLVCGGAILELLRLLI